MRRLNGHKIVGTLTKPMTGKEALRYMRDTYQEKKMDRDALLRAAWDHGLSARGIQDGRFYALFRRDTSPVTFIIEEGTAENFLADLPERVAKPVVRRYSTPIASTRTKAPTNKDVIRMAARAVTKARPATKKAKPAPEPEPEVEEDDLEDELEDEEDEELEDELDDEDEDDDDEDEDEDEDDEEDEEVEDEADEDEDDSPDYTPYASKSITPTMVDFAQWMDDKIFKPIGSSIKEVGKTDPVRLIAIAGTARMEFQKSDFNIRRREERKQEAAAEKAAKAKPVAKKPVATKTPGGAKVVGKAKARPKVATAAAPARPARATAGKTTAKKKKAAPF